MAKMNIIISQNLSTKELTLKHNNEIQIINILTNESLNRLNFNFSNSKKYNWYNANTNTFGRTEGGNSGNLLHGKYKMYYPNGSLKVDGSYKMGLAEGEWKYWDSKGNLISTVKYKDNDVFYQKNRDSIKLGSTFSVEGWIEKFGNYPYSGWVKIYDLNNSLIREDSVSNNYIHYYKEYLSGKKLEVEYARDIFGDEYGNDISYYNNGKKKFEGHYCDTVGGLRNGTWKWYNYDGTIKAIENYKAEVINTPNKEILGSYFFNEQMNKWVKYGKWKEISISNSGKPSLTEIIYDYNGNEIKREIKLKDEN